MRSKLALATAIVALSACSEAPNTANETAALPNNGVNAPEMNDAMAPPTAEATINAASYLAKAGAGDLFEIESSKAVLAKTSNADVKMFANMMVDNHSKSTEKLKAAAKADGVSVSPPKLDPSQQSMLDEIKSTQADRVDAIYKAHQAQAHQAALALQQGYAADGDKPALKKAATEIIPVIQKHIEALGKLPG